MSGTKGLITSGSVYKSIVENCMKLKKFVLLLKLDQTWFFNKSENSDVEWKWLFNTSENLDVGMKSVCQKLKWNKKT